MLIVHKKGWIIISIISALLLILVFTLPLQSNVNESIRFSTNSDAIFRQLMRDTVWHQWWSGRIQMVNQKAVFIQDEFEFTIQRILPNTFDLNTTSNSFSIHSSLHIIPETENKVTVRLSANIALSYNPISRIRTLFLSSKLKVSYKKILSNLSNHFGDNKNLYDVDIKELAVPFEYVTTLSKTFKHSPEISEIYFLVDRIKSHIKGKGGEEKGFPMLHIAKISEGQFFTQVAIPTDKPLPEFENIKSKWMLKGGNILSAEVTGNRRAISNAIQQMEFYIQDTHRSKVAIFFESLVTNRLENPDSNKWVTRIYFPVI